MNQRRGLLDELRSRLNTPGARWHSTERCDQEMNALRLSDPEAWSLIEALRRDAVDFGLDPIENRDHPHGDRAKSYRCPVGKALQGAAAGTDVAVPWLGELDVDGTIPVDHKTVHWRYYFMEPRTRTLKVDDYLLGCSVRAKGVGLHYSAAEQTRHMRDAMEAGKRWCKRQDPPMAWRQVQQQVDYDLYVRGEEASGREGSTDGSSARR